MVVRGGCAEVTLDKVSTEVSEMVLNSELRMTKPGNHLKEEHSRQKLQMLWMGLLYQETTQEAK